MQFRFRVNVVGFELRVRICLHSDSEPKPDPAGLRGVRDVCAAPARLARLPGHRVERAHACCRTPDTRNPKPGCLASNLTSEWFRVPGFGCMVKPQTRIPEPEIRNPDPGSRNLKPDTRMEPGTRNPKTLNWNPRPCNQH